ncbi:MAG TPA: hypothetical protein VLJ76_06995 [Gaiellaceae bacterium]|nr:hypothetical protein [Gaiellaceae bacterium]
MRYVRGLSRGGRIGLAFAVGGAVFGIATAVQASIPDGNAVVHSCYNTSLAHGSPIGAMRAIDTEKAGGVCASWEGAVDLATPQYVQNVVTSTVNQTSFMVRDVSDPLPPNEWVDDEFCPTGYVATDFSLGATDETFGSDSFITIQSLQNYGEVTTGIPDTHGKAFFKLTGTTSVTFHMTCVDGRVFGEAAPLVPLARAEAQATGSFRPAR